MAATKKYLDIEGLKHLWTKIKTNENAITALTVNGKAISTNPVLDGTNIALTGYSDTDVKNEKPVAGDTINQAIGKLQGQIDDDASVTSGSLSELDERVEAVKATADAALPAATHNEFVAGTTGTLKSNLDAVKVSITGSTLVKAEVDTAGRVITLSDDAALTTAVKDLGLKDDDNSKDTAFGRIKKAEEDITSLKGSVSGGTFFKGVVPALPDPKEADYKNGDIVAIASSAEANANKEFIYSGESTKGKWVELGDTTKEGQRLTDLEDGTKAAGKATVLANSRNFVIGGVTKPFNGSEDVTITKADMDLDKVNNTADKDKSVKDARFAAKIGTEAAPKAIGSATQTIYVAEDGTVTAGTTLGTASTKNEEHFAKAAQGAKADSAIQGVTADGQYLSATNDTDDKHRKISANVASLEEVKAGEATKLVDAIQAKAYADFRIGKLAKEDTAEAHNYVTAVSEVNGVITVVRAQPTVEDLSDWDNYAMTTDDINKAITNAEQAMGK